MKWPGFDKLENMLKNLEKGASTPALSYEAVESLGLALTGQELMDAGKSAARVVSVLYTLKCGVCDERVNVWVPERTSPELVQMVHTETAHRVSIVSEHLRQPE